MNPLQRNKVDIKSLSPDEQRIFRLYGKLPDKKDLLANKLKGQERKYFDSGDYALSKAGKASDVGITSLGREHPSPDNIPHLTPQVSQGHNGSISGPSGMPGAGGHSGSPIKEGSFLNRETSAEDVDREANNAQTSTEAPKDDLDQVARTISPPTEREGMPIRGA